jgi:8-oxo-dGTP diphosphatase
VADVPRSVDEINWPAWKPTERATLCFVIRDGKILLIRKKRGLGAGKIVGPGGRLEPGETPRACAIREVQEELCVTPTGVVARGEHYFQFLDGYAIRVFAFSADDCNGFARETAEAIPAWTGLDAIPYPEMWQDNRIWLPLLLAGVPFSGRYVFDGDTLLDYRIEQRFDAALAEIVP